MMSTDTPEKKEEGQQPNNLGHSDTKGHTHPYSAGKTSPSSPPSSEICTEEPFCPETVVVTQESFLALKSLSPHDTTKPVSFSPEGCVFNSEDTFGSSPSAPRTKGSAHASEDEPELINDEISSSEANHEIVAISKTPNTTSTTTPTTSKATVAVTTRTTLSVVSASLTASIFSSRYSSSVKPPPSPTPAPPPSFSVTSPPNSISPVVAEMGLQHPLVEVNGHAHPRGVGENREVSRNPSALPAAPSPSTALHRDRLIGPVTASVATPRLRREEALRERLRLSSVSRRLMSRPVKRKLWDVDHEQMGREIEAEYTQIVEEDEKRFRERWEELEPKEMPDAPRFYYSKVIHTKEKSSTASTSTLEERVPDKKCEPENSNKNDTVSTGKAPSPITKDAKDSSVSHPDCKRSSLPDEMKNGGGETPTPKTSVIPSTDDRISNSEEDKNVDVSPSSDVSPSLSSALSTPISPSSLNSSSLSGASVASTSFSSSSSGVLSLDSTSSPPSETSRPDASSRGDTSPIVRTPSQPLQPRRPTTRSSQQRSSRRKRSTDPPPRKQLRM